MPIFRRLMSRTALAIVLQTDAAERCAFMVRVEHVYIHLRFCDVQLSTVVDKCRQGRYLCTYRFRDLPTRTICMVLELFVGLLCILRVLVS